MAFDEGGPQAPVDDPNGAPISAGTLEGRVSQARDALREASQSRDPRLIASAVDELEDALSAERRAGARASGSGTVPGEAEGGRR